RQASGEPGANVRAVSSAARSSSPRRSAIALLDPPSEAHVIAAPSTAPTATRIARTASAVRVVGRTNVNPQSTTSNAADPAVTHKRNAEVPISESTPSITPSTDSGAVALGPGRKYGAGAAAMPAGDRKMAIRPAGVLSVFGSRADFSAGSWRS